MYSATSHTIPVKITSYAGNYIYEKESTTESLQFFSHPEGYVEKNGSNFNYVYQYKDHLGNVRLSYADTDNNGIIDANSEIISEKNYYPFGLTHKGYNNIVQNSNSVASKFKYNGKELNDELGLDWYDYGARNYDAALGRWMNIDPHAETYYDISPYNYAANSPIIFADPDGMNIIISWEINGESKSMTYTYDKDRSLSDDLPDFVKNTFASLDQLYSTGASKVNFGTEEEPNVVDVVGAFMNNEDHDFTIKEGSSNKYKRDSNTVLFNSENGAEFRKDLSIGWTEENTGRNSASALLGHEIIHAYNDEFDNKAYLKRRGAKFPDWRKTAPYFPNMEEKSTTTNWANQINRKLGQDERTHYMRGYYPTIKPTSTTPKTK